MPDDERCLATQLKDELWKMIRSMFHDCSSRISTARHRHQTRNPIRHQLVTDFWSATGQEVYHAFREAGLLHQPYHFDRAEGSVARGLRHNCVSGNQGWSKLPCNGGRRKVPGRNRRNDPDGELQYHNRLPRILARQNISLNPPRKLGIVLEVGRSTIDLSPRLEQWFSLFRG